MVAYADALIHWWQSWNFSMKLQSLSTSSGDMALYMETRSPPTDLWPFNETKPALVASSRNIFSSASTPLGPPILSGAFM